MMVRRQNTNQRLSELLDREGDFPDAPETPEPAPVTPRSDAEPSTRTSERGMSSRMSTVGQVVSTGVFELGETSAASAEASVRIYRMRQEAEAEAKRLKAEAEQIRREAEEFRRDAMREAERILGDAHRDRDIAVAEVAATAGLARRSQQELVRQRSGSVELTAAEARRAQCSWIERQEALAMSSEAGSCSDLQQLRAPASLSTAPEHAVAEVAVAGRRRWRDARLRIPSPRRRFLNRTAAGSATASPAVPSPEAPTARRRGGGDRTRSEFAASIGSDSWLPGVSRRQPSDEAERSARASGSTRAHASGGDSPGPPPESPEMGRRRRQCDERLRALRASGSSPQTSTVAHEDEFEQEMSA
jgi:hypothetical protein